MNPISRLTGIAVASMALAALPCLAASQSLANLYLSPSDVGGGMSSTGTVELDHKAPSGGIVITLASSESSATVPASVTVAANSRKATFTIGTASVTAKESASISATGPGGKSISRELRILPAYLDSLSLDPVSVTGGESSTATLSLKGVAPTGGLAVTLFSNVSFALVPMSVTVPAGSSSATFSITTSDVTAAGRAVILATDANGHAAIAELRVTVPIVLQLKRLSIHQDRIVGGSSTTGVIELNGPALSGGFTVNLASNESFAQVPATVTVPEGSKMVTFTITTGDVGTRSSATITATDSTGKSDSAKLVVGPIHLDWVSISPDSILGGSIATGTIRLDAPAPAGGFTVTVSSNQSFLEVPTTVTIPEGSQDVTFMILTTAVLTRSHAKITVTDANGQTVSTEVEIRV